MMAHAHALLWNTRSMAIATWNDTRGTAIERGLAMGTPGQRPPRGSSTPLELACSDLQSVGPC